jgi:hypothetical protein
MLDPPVPVELPVLALLEAVHEAKTTPRLTEARTPQTYFISSR